VTAAWSAPALVGRHAAEAPDAPALVEPAERTSWAELDRRAELAAAEVRSRGVVPGDTVALLPDGAASTIAALIGVLRAGGVALPVPAGLTRRELAGAIAATNPALVVRPEELRRAGDPPEPAGRPRRPPDSEAAAVVVMTSGTEGLPKGVILSAAALAASADAWLSVLPSPTGWLLALSLGHVAGLGVVWRAIRDRVPVSIAPGGDPEAQLAALRASAAPSHVSLVPTQLVRLLDVAGDEPAPATVRAVLLGGGPLPPALVTRALDLGWPVVPTYGLSETASGVTALPTAEARNHPTTAGRPLPGAALRIEDADRAGIGEIVVTTPAGFSGYVGGPRRERHVPIRTGDGGRIDDAGRLIVVSRRFDRIVRGGENLSPAEVEAVLETHPAVAEAAVVGRPDPVLGQVPVAAIVVRTDAADPGDAALAAHARESLAAFKVPVEWLRLDALPRTSSGKLQRTLVRALVDGSRAGILARPGRDRIGWRTTGDGRLPVVLLPGTLSSAGQLDPLATALAETGDVTIHAIDRRGTGTSRLGQPRPIDIGVHVADVVAYLDARGIDAATVVGISYGGVLGLELAARHPNRTLGLVAWEPPYGALLDGPARSWFPEVAARTAAAHRSGGPAAAAETFLRAVAGDAAWDGLSDRSRAYLAAEGDGALADAALLGLEPDGLVGITAPVVIVTGEASRPIYRPLAEALAARVPGVLRVAVPGRAHTWPLTDPRGFAEAVRSSLTEMGLLAAPGPAVPAAEAPAGPGR
jgi:O-succinylbenzoic acid--CoA ligase